MNPNNLRIEPWGKGDLPLMRCNDWRLDLFAVS
jgi:hypothetical protein